MPSTLSAPGHFSRVNYSLKGPLSSRTGILRGKETGAQGRSGTLKIYLTFLPVFLFQETDYIMSYFDNGEDFGGDSDDNMDEAIY